jgi:hypothetical protein
LAARIRFALKIETLNLARGFICPPGTLGRTRYLSNTVYLSMWVARLNPISPAIVYCPAISRNEKITTSWKP